MEIICFQSFQSDQKMANAVKNKQTNQKKQLMKSPKTNMQ